MFTEIGITILVSIIAAPILWILKKLLAVPILRTFKKAYGAVENKCRKLRLKSMNNSHQNDEENKKSEIEADSHKYNENYRKRYGQLNVSGVEIEVPISLDDVSVTAQFLHEREVTYKSSEGIARALREESKSHPKSIYHIQKDGVSIANDEQYLMVLGSPGVGKSTFLRKVGFEASKGKDGDFEHEHIPVFLEIKQVSKDRIDVKALITEQFKICGYPNPKQKAMSALESGNLLILFDGLDEAPNMSFNNIVREIGGFVNQYNQNRFIASSRKAVNTGGFTLFTSVEMAAFNDSQIEAYIKNWFTSTYNLHHQQIDAEIEIAQQCWEALNVPENQALKELAQNPVLLTLLCMVYDNSQNFPRNRATLYKEAFNILLKKWEDAKLIPRDTRVSEYLETSVVKEMLIEIAVKNFNADRFLLSRNELINQIQKFCQASANTSPTFNAPKILDTIHVDTGIFVEKVNGFYSFFHLTFQQYLTATHFAESAESVQQLVTKHLHDERWRGIFLFTAELVSDSLLVEIEAEASKFINTDNLKTLFQWAKRITNTSDTLHSGVAKRSFAIRQYLSLCLLNKVYEIVNRYPDINSDSSLEQYFDFYRDYTRDHHLYNDLYLDFNQLPNLNIFLKGEVDEKLLDLGGEVEEGLPYSDGSLDEELCLYLNQNYNPYQDLRIFLKLYCSLAIDLYPDPDFDFYQDLYQFTDTHFYPSISSIFGGRFDSELRKRITLVQLIEEAKIFKRVDLQVLIQRFYEQRKFIKAASEGKSVRSPDESIHNTWLSVLGITSDMLAISREEVENYIRYLRAMKLILDCKKAAGRVSSEIWQTIENRLLACDIEEIEN